MVMAYFVILSELWRGVFGGARLGYRPPSMRLTHLSPIGLTEPPHTGRVPSAAPVPVLIEIIRLCWRPPWVLLLPSNPHTTANLRLQVFRPAQSWECHERRRPTSVARQPRRRPDSLRD